MDYSRTTGHLKNNNNKNYRQTTAGLVDYSQSDGPQSDYWTTVGMMDYRQTTELFA